MLSQGAVVSQGTIPFWCFSSLYNMDLIKSDSKTVSFDLPGEVRTEGYLFTYLRACVYKV